MGRRIEKYKKGSNNGPRHKFRERERNEVVGSCWRCVKWGHMQPNSDKDTAIESVSNPTTVRQERAFIRIISYYRRFIRIFSDIAEPLIKLTRKYTRFQLNDAF